VIAIVRDEMAVMKCRVWYGEWVGRCGYGGLALMCASAWILVVREVAEQVVVGVMWVWGDCGLCCAWWMPLATGVFTLHWF